MTGRPVQDVCARGHDRSEGSTNVYVAPNGIRYCRECLREADRRRDAKDSRRRQRERFLSRAIEPSTEAEALYSRWWAEGHPSPKRHGDRQYLPASESGLRNFAQWACFGEGILRSELSRICGWPSTFITELLSTRTFYKRKSWNHDGNKNSST